MADNRKNDETLNENNVLELIDEDGNTVPFEHLDTVRINNNDYIICIPYDDDQEEVTEIAMFKIDKDVSSEDCLSQVVDEALAEKIYEEFKKRNADKFDFED
ncbi:MAG: DUF1292 domain-containing protein [Clostridiales bacterium]|nr:DUF1292 domain-containing protein [Clostridiales bacterium]